MGGRTIPSYTLRGKTGVRLSFLRLPDGTPDGGGTATYAHHSLLKLFHGKIRVLQPVDGTSSYTEQQLIDTLTTLAEHDGIKRILTLDYDDAVFGHTYTQGADHSDHGVAGRYFRCVAFRLPGGVTTDVRGHLGYDVSRLPENLSPVQGRQKDTIFQSYRRGAGCESRQCPAGHYMSGKYEQWVRREYSLKPRTAQPGQIVSAMGLADRAGRRERCLSSAEIPSNSRKVVEVSTANCDGSRGQFWHIHTGTIESASGRHCLTAAGRQTILSACLSSSRQKWRMDAYERIESGGRCLFQEDLAAPNPRLVLRPCAPLRPELTWHTAR
ncbi:RICIN domain-containing protein [Streptomyces sp. NPDC048213]|uniref:RICIN domain-containing protein n=1 Tax=Streptomyces TaxID=1883 RepID=UPI0033CDDFFE